jgi:hypothetical protein
LIGGLAMPVEIADRDKIEPYQKWFEEQFMSDLRDLFPDTYQQVIDYLRDFILMPWENDDDDRPE